MGNQPPTHQQTLLIQLDGVSYDVLQNAIASGYCPTIAKLCKRKKYSIIPFHVGAPALTHATVSHLFFGKNSIVPAFMWYDRQLHRFVRPLAPHDTPLIEKRLDAIGRPLLTGGSAVCAPYVAGALCTSLMPDDIDIQSRMALMRGFQLMYRYVLHPTVSFQIIFLGIRRMLRSMFGKNRPQTVDAFIRQVRHFGQQLLFSDITRNEIIRVFSKGYSPYYVDYVLYDEMAHENGKLHTLAFEALRQVDRDIRIMLGAMYRSYQSTHVYIFSDHGHMDAVPFSSTAHVSIETQLQQWFNESSAHFTTSDIFETGNPGSHRIFACASGSLLQIYFKGTDIKPTLEGEIETRYPGSIQRIMQTPGIGGVVTRVSCDIRHIHTKVGVIRVRNGKVDDGPVSEGMDLLRVTQKDLDSFAAYVMYPDVGDLIVFGGVLPDGKIIGFENQHSLHGGWFGDMMWPFVMTNDEEFIKEVTQDPSLETVVAHIRATVFSNRKK